ncbi:hypothetical protein O181_056131 [Austropuccinia psidii MF-1]|uniref:Uncharacterized protein n=1 Tax=Austropuccinia psidii MF-1 TaxID=1389203 RepID=A0A9Q3HSN3_9BASI|nr:hypothetical protein [Austropuccinia psidii MF-1]
MYKTEVINLIQRFQHELRNLQRCSNSKLNDIEQLLHTLPRISTPLNKNEGARIPNQQLLDVDNSPLKNEFSTSFHNLEPPMGQALLKEVSKLKEWPHFSGEGEYYHMEVIRGDLEHAVKSRTTEQSSAEDIINRLEKVTTRAIIGSKRVNFKTWFNTPWEDSVDNNPKENSNNIKYKSADVIRKLHTCQSTTHLADTCPKKGKINEIDIEKEPDVETDEVIEDNSDDKSSIFSEYSKYIENSNSTFDIMESYSYLPQAINVQINLSRIQDAQPMKTKPNRGKGYTAGNSCIAEVVIDNKPTKLLLDPGEFCSCVGKSFLKTCVPNFEDQLFPIDGIKFNSASIPMKVLGIFEATVIFPHQMEIYE